MTSLPRLTPEQERQLREAEREATPGPWEEGAGRDGNNAAYSYIETPAGWLVTMDEDRHEADAALIALARTLLPSLLSELDAVRAERDEARLALGAAGVLDAEETDALLAAMENRCTPEEAEQRVRDAVAFLAKEPRGYAPRKR